jgi:hypothetical protein
MEEFMAVARTLAATGHHANWRGVETRMMQLGFLEAEDVLKDPMLREALDALCTFARKDGQQTEPQI